MRGIEVEALAWRLGGAQRLLGDAGEDGVALAKEGVERAAEAVVVELGGRDVPEDVRTGFLRPGGDVDQGGRAGQPRGQEEAEDLAMREFELRVGGQMAVDDAGDVPAFQQ